MQVTPWPVVAGSHHLHWQLNFTQNLEFLPVINRNLLIANIKSQIKAALWNTSCVANFDNGNPFLFTSVVHAETVTIMLQGKTFKNFNRTL